MTQGAAACHSERSRGISKVTDGYSNPAAFLGEDSPLLYTHAARGGGLTWLAERPPAPDGVALECQVRLRHRQPLQACALTLAGGRAHMEFAAPQRAVTPGQSAVFYDGQVCLGGAIVDSATH